MTCRFGFRLFCHPEPGPELNSGSTISGSRFWVWNLVLKPRPVGGVLYLVCLVYLVNQRNQINKRNSKTKREAPGPPFRWSWDYLLEYWGLRLAPLLPYFFRS